MKPSIIPFKADKKKLSILDQTVLPADEKWVEVTNAKETYDSIKKMHVRGAPAIGVTAAYGFYLEVRNLINNNKRISFNRLKEIKNQLDSSRPTAVNLSWATSSMLEISQELITTLKCNNEVVNEKSKKAKKFIQLLWEKAKKIHEDDAERCLNMSKHAADHIEKTLKKEKLNALTHCNTGSLATGGIGTALGAIRVMHSRDKILRVYADETRPYNQGARLTAFELLKEKIPSTLIIDSMAAYLMQKKMIDFVIVGSDRITRNGDVANKIGTYMLSIAAKEHKIPFYVVAPLSTLDASMKYGSEIPIEKRDDKEITHFKKKRVAADIPVLNYSFDVTPYENITAIITEEGEYIPSSE